MISAKKKKKNEILNYITEREKQQINRRLNDNSINA